MIEIKLVKKNEFVKIKKETLYFMATLGGSEKIVLFFILAKMNKQNIITISTDLRKLIEEKADISRATIFTALNGLKEKKVLIYPSNEALREKYNIYSKNSFIVNLG